jgi:hypothetical protein
MFKTIAATTLLILAVTVGANASSGKSWDALFAKASGTCIGKSGMVTPEASSPVVFEDSVGKVAILLRESAGKGKATKNLLCLYDKQTGRASIQEYRWLGN